jgi:hypothetical protein
MTEPEFAAEINRIQVALMNLAIEVGALAARVPVKPAPIAPRLPLASRGQNLKVILDTLRTAEAPMTVREITARVVVAWGHDPEDRKMVNAMIERVRVALIRQQRRGLLRSRMAGEVALWEVAR